MITADRDNEGKNIDTAPIVMKAWAKFLEEGGDYRDFEIVSPTYQMDAANTIKFLKSKLKGDK